MIENRSNDLLLQNLSHIQENIRLAAQRTGRALSDIRLMAVTKTVAPEIVNQVIAQGVTLLGENRVQEFLGKWENYAGQHEVHFIGHLQTNKVKYIIDKVSMIQSVDSCKLAQEINRQAARTNKIMDILVEVNIGGEASKSGVLPQDLEQLIEEISVFDHICIKGLMTIPPICEEKAQIRKYFKQLRQLFIDINAKKLDNVCMQVLSMGMSGDYEIAVEEGANIIRVGTALFGTRQMIVPHTDT